MKKIITILISILLMSCPMQTSLPQGDWTVMFYLGDDNSGLNIIQLYRDVDELTKNSVKTSANRFFILYDGPQEGDSKLEVLDNPFGITSKVIDLKSTLIPVTNNNELDMSNKNTLKEFINYCKKKSPSDKYALFFGSHGTGFTETTKASLQIDSLNELSIVEINQVLEETGKIDLIAFDACFMGNIENIYEFKNSADYLVASPEATAGPGNEYTSLIERIFISENLTPYQLGVETIENYYNHYKNNTDPTNDSGNRIYKKDLLQVYDIKNLDKILTNIDFSTLPKTANKGSYNPETGTTIDSFNPNGFGGANQYRNIFGVIESNPIYTENNSIITKPENGLYKYISIYMPSNPATYNSAYEETKFAKDFPKWVEIIKN